MFLSYDKKYIYLIFREVFKLKFTLDIKLFKKNLKFFKKEKPSIYNLIKEFQGFASFKEREKKLPDIKLIMIPSFSPDIDSVSYREWIHDIIMYDWDTILKKYYSFENLEKEIRENKYIPLVLLHGLDGGNAIDILYKDELEFDYLLIFEPDIKSFILSLYTVDWKSVISKKNVFFILGNKKEIIEEALLKYFSYHSPVNAIFFLALSFHDNKKEFDKILEKSVVLAMKGWGYYDDEKEGLLNVYENLNHKVKYLYKPKQVNKSSNVIIVGSGPSLDETIDFIKENRNRAVIFSCGTAIHKLYKEGIVPDFQIELERPKSRVEFFKNLPEDYRKKITIIAADVVPYDLLSLYKDAIVFPREYSMTQYLLNPMYYPIGIAPTVTNTALGVAAFLGFENIYLIGVDMGYKTINKKHASGTIYGEIVEEADFDNYLKIKGNVHDYVYTDDIFFWAKNNLEFLIKSLKDRNFINISRGAEIKGTTFVYDYEELKLKSFNKEKLVEDILSNVTLDYQTFFKVEKKDYISLALDFLNKIEISISSLLEKDSFRERISSLYSINSLKRDLADRDKAIATMLNGTVMHLQIKLLYFAYLAQSLSEKEKEILKLSLERIKEDIKNLKPYFDFFNQLH